MADLNFRTEEKSLDDLIPADWNPREIDDKALDGLERCILRYGLVQPIVWNERTGHVVGGHQRLKVLRRNGALRTQVVVVSLSSDEEKALSVSLNNEMIQGRWTEGLGALLASIGDGATIDGLRTDDLVESLGGSDWDLGPVESSRPPKLVWTIVAVPEGREGEAAPYIEKISQIEGAFVESVKK